jgi:LDH2 family malate/lactate/ureidoglycolate dehydrogenase
MADFANEVRLQPRMPGIERIYLPGEPEQAKGEEAARIGVLLPEAGWQELDELAERLGVTPLAERLETDETAKTPRAPRTIGV